jgi:hypothetical protein
MEPVEIADKFSCLNSLGSFGFRRMQRQSLPRAACHNAEKVW